MGDNSDPGYSATSMQYPDDDNHEGMPEEIQIPVTCYPGGYIAAYGNSLFSFSNKDKAILFINNLFSASQKRSHLYACIMKETLDELSTWDIAGCDEACMGSSDLIDLIMDNLSRFLVLVLQVYGPIYDPHGKSIPADLIKTGR